MIQFRIILCICLIPSIAYAQDYKDVSYWLGEIDPSSSEKPSMKISDYELRDIQPATYSFSLKDKPSDFSGIKPLSYSDQLNTWLLTKNIRFENINFDYYKPSKLSFRNPKNIDLRINYKLMNQLSLELSGCYIADKYRNPKISDNLLYRSEIATNLSYSITKNLKIKSGMQYMYNPVTGRWEYVYMTGIVFNL